MKSNEKFTKLLVFALTLAVFGTQELFSQEVMNIRKKDNTVIAVPTSDIESISFTGSQEDVSVPEAELPEGSITDIDKNIYKTARIGFQTWTASNLKVKRFKNGEAILHAKSDEEWTKAGEEGKPAWCYYLNSSGNGETFGVLYNWHAINDKRGLVPEGWRISNEQDWDALRKAVGSNPAISLKDKGTDLWMKNTDNVTNQTEFTALPGGYRHEKGAFNSAGSQGIWWSDTESGETSARGWIMYDYSGSLSGGTYPKGRGFSVRCVKE